jgi:CheY-like chemotaxis protein
MLEVETTAHPRRRQILVVEDDVQLRRLMTLALTFAGFAVREVGDGIEALRTIDADPPALIVLDIALPGVDGLSVHAELLTDPRTRHIPVVVVTGTSRDLGALETACVLRKPVHPDDVVRAVERCLQSGSPAAGS